MKITVKELVYAALFGAVLVAVQLALASLPNIELVSLFVIVLARHFRRLAVYAVYAFVMMEGLIFGFGMWWVSYLYVWALLYIIAWLCWRADSAVFWALIGAAFGLCFGAMTAIPYLFAGGIYAAVSYFIAGIPFDIAHCAGNFVTILLLYRPLDRLFTRIRAAALLPEGERTRLEDADA